MYKNVYQRNSLLLTLEKTEGAINNRQSRDTGNIGHTRHGTKQTKYKNTTQHRKLKRWAAWTPPKNGVLGSGEPRYSGR